jgi:hypothetical protein
MLIPLTRQQFDTLIPRIATSEQYQYCWGKAPDFLNRLLISVIGGVVVLALDYAFKGFFKLPLLLGGVTLGFYWFWSPILWASLRNAKYRRYPYCGFWQGEVLDVYVTNEVIGTEETVNKRGDLVVVQNRERCLNVEVGDDIGFSTLLKAPLRPEHRIISRGQAAQMLLLSSFPDLSRIARATDIYLPECRLWVSDYPFLRRDAFMQVSQRLSEPELDQPSWRSQSKRRQTAKRRTTNRRRSQRRSS